MTSRLLLLTLLISLLAIAVAATELNVAELWKVLNRGGNDVQTKEQVQAEPRSTDSRQHKAFFVNYPVMQRVYKDKDLETSESRKRHKQRRRPNRKPESDIYFIKLPPAPYSYIEGVGYISQPPVFSPASIPKPKLKPKPFVKLPIDFVSNGKPTKVYHWPHSKLDNQVVRLNHGPYNFNGKPKSIYVIKKKPKGNKPVLTKEYRKKVVVKQ